MKTKTNKNRKTLPWNVWQGRKDMLVFQFCSWHLHGRASRDLPSSPLPQNILKSCNKRGSRIYHIKRGHRGSLRGESGSREWRVSNDLKDTQNFITWRNDRREFQDTKIESEKNTQRLWECMERAKGSCGLFHFYFCICFIIYNTII